MPLDLQRVYGSGSGIAVGTSLRQRAKQPRLAARDFDLRAVAQRDVQPAAIAELDPRDVLQVDELAAIGAEETARIELRFQRRERAGQQRALPAPEQPHV